MGYVCVARVFEARVEVVFKRVAQCLIPGITMRCRKMNQLGLPEIRSKPSGRFLRTRLLAYSRNCREWVGGRSSAIKPTFDAFGLVDPFRAIRARVRKPASSEIPFLVGMRFRVPVVRLCFAGLQSFEVAVLMLQISVASRQTALVAFRALARIFSTGHRSSVYRLP